MELSSYQSTLMRRLRGRFRTRCDKIFNRMSMQPFSHFGPLVTAMVTPFTPSGDVDYTRAEELTTRLLENGSTGLVVSGTTGESPTLSPTEKLELFRVVKRAAGNAPVI